MSNYNFEGQSDGDWDERNEISWKEYDWQQYLKRHEQEVERFIECYNRLKEEPEHIDQIAREMGWDAEDWSVSEGYEDEQILEFERPQEEEERPDDFDPYTLLRHPVFVVVRGLYRSIRRHWELFQRRNERNIRPTGSWKLSQTLSDGENFAVLAIQALDMGDYALAVCQLKLSLSAINRTFELMPLVIPTELPDSGPLSHEMRIRLFDLREVNLRVLSDCREEIRRQGRERD